MSLWNWILTGRDMPEPTVDAALVKPQQSYQSLQRERAAQLAARRARLKILFQEQEPTILLQRDEFRLKAADEHRRQVAGFRFQCSRWGAFLMISSARDQAVEPEFSTSLNLKNINAIRLVDGSAPDDRGVVGYYGFHDQSGTPSLRPDYPMLPADRRHFCMSAATSEIDDDDYDHEMRTEGFPRAARDDAIHFVGLPATLFVPHGCGQSVLEQILLSTEGFGEPRTPTP